MKDKTIGILGGMGPEATAYFFKLIIELTKAEKDQDHIPIIIYNNPKVPHRTDAILKGKESPLPFLIEGSKILENSGADFIVIPCVTAHYFYNELIKNINIPILHLIEETFKFVKKELKNIKNIGLLATKGTIKTKLFPKYFEKGGYYIIPPDEEDQNKVMEAIYSPEGIKAGYKNNFPRNLLIEVSKKLINKKNCQAIIGGCTEIPLALKKDDLSVPFINPLEIIARECIKRAGKEIRNLGK